MDAALAWEIVGSVAAVVAVPTALGVGLVQLRGNRTGAQSDLQAPDRTHDGGAIKREPADDPNGREGAGPPQSAEAESGRRAMSNESTLASMRSIAGYRDWEQLRTLAMSTPRAAVLAAWRTLAFIIYKVAYTEKCLVTEDWNTELSLIVLRMGASQRTIDLITDIQQMRDRAESGQTILRTDALEYIDAAEAVLNAWLGKEGSISHEHRAR
jgi:hypothetical protein